MTTRSPGDCHLLAGLSVLEIGGGASGSVATAILGSLGANVVKVESPAGRGDIASRRVNTGAGSFSAFNVTVDRQKRFEDAGADLDALLAEADIVVSDGPCDTAIRPTDGVHVVISPFGLDGPYARNPGGEIIAQASGGLLGTIEATDGTPVPIPGFVALRAAGTVAALAALHGWDRHTTSGGLVEVDVSVQEAVVLTAALPECAHVLYDCPGHAGSGRYVAPSGLFPCLDGLVRITAVENHQWTGMVAALGAPAWTAGLDERSARISHAELITERVTEWTLNQDKAACAELLQTHGVPAAPVNAPAELLSSPQFAHRGSLITTTLAGSPAVVLGNPWRICPGAPTKRPRSGRLADLRVAELTHVLAGPIVGALLGAMGARVVRLEDPDRLDIYRRIGPFAGGQAGVERGAYFAVANHSKKSVLIDPQDASHDVAAVLGDSDVVIENVGSSRLSRLGVDPGRLANTGTLTMRVSGFGSDGPMGGYKVYANSVQSYGGLAGLVVGPDGSPARMGTVIADPLSSVVAATVVTAWAVGPQRDIGAVVDLSMAEVVASTVAEFVAAASIDQQSHPLEASTPLAGGVYRCADQRWVAIQPPSDQRADLNLATVIASLTSAEVVDQLASMGVSAALVQRGPDLVTDPHLAARGFFPAIDYPDPDVSKARLVGLPWRFVGDGPIVLAPPPALGSSTIQTISRESRSHVD